MLLELLYLGVLSKDSNKTFLIYEIICHIRNGSA